LAATPARKEPVRLSLHQAMRLNADLKQEMGKRVLVRAKAK
jgi:hypothetical protein